MPRWQIWQHPPYSPWVPMPGGDFLTLYAAAVYAEVVKRRTGYPVSLALTED